MKGLRSNILPHFQSTNNFIWKAEKNKSNDQQKKSLKTSTLRKFILSSLKLTKSVSFWHNKKERRSKKETTSKKSLKSSVNTVRKAQVYRKAKRQKRIKKI